MEKNNENNDQKAVSKAVAHEVEDADTLFASEYLEPPPLFAIADTKQVKEESETEEKDQKESPAEITSQADQEASPDPLGADMKSDAAVLQSNAKVKEDEKEEEILDSPSIDLIFTNDTPSNPNDDGDDDKSAGGNGEEGESGDDDPMQKKEKEGSSNSSNSGSSHGVPADVMSKMEASMGADFSNVKIHTNSSQAASANALAFAQGNEVHFAPGQFNPNSKTGQELLGHELAHIKQQSEGRVKPTTTINGQSVNDDQELEAEADEMGAKAANSKFESGDFPKQTNNLSSVGVPQFQLDTVTQRKGATIKEGNTILTESFSPYDISGTYRNICDQLADDKEDGSITTTITDIDYNSEDGTSVKVVLQVTMVKSLPNWTDFPKIKELSQSENESEENKAYYSKIVKAWDSFMKSLDAHEEEHRKIDLENYSNIHSVLIDKDLEDMNDLLEVEENRISGLHEKFHDKTSSIVKSLPYIQKPSEKKVDGSSKSEVQYKVSSQPVRQNFITDTELEVRDMNNNPHNYRTDEENLEVALNSKDVSDIRNVHNFSGATQAQRIEFIGILLNQGWVGPSDESCLERIWNSFGSSLSNVANSNFELWSSCIDRGMDPSSISAANTLRENFRNDVKNKAREYIQANIEFAEQELINFGIEGDNSDDPYAETTQEMLLSQTRELADSAIKLRDAQDRMRNLVVGYEIHGTDYLVGGGMRARIEEVRFNPGSRPSQATYPGRTPDKTYDETLAKWNETESALSQIQQLSPTIFSAMSQDRDLSQLASDDTSIQSNAIRQTLTTLKSNAQATLPKIGNGDLDWKDLTPIHQQLFSGMEVTSGTSWSNEFNKSIAQDVIGDHQSREFWISLGLGTLAAAAFIISEFATGGLATGLWLGAGIGLSGAQAVRSWENYEDMATANQGSASSETSIISEGQVDGARLGAIIDSVFFFLDVVAPAMKIGRSIMSARQLERTVADRTSHLLLDNLSELGSAEVARNLQSAIAELGVAETARRSGLTIEQITSRVTGQIGGEAEELLLRRLSDATARLSEEAGESGLRVVGTAAENSWLTGKSMNEALSGVVDAVASNEISRTFADQLVSEAIDTLGPAAVLRTTGWDALAKVLTDNSIAGQKLMQFRNSVFDDLEHYVTDVLEGTVERTGTQGNFSNDLDMSFTGANSSQVKTQASEYLARRLGIASDATSFDRVLSLGLFTDPRRMHAYDMLPTEIRESVASMQAAKQEQLIWNRRLWEASHEGNEALAQQTREMMNDLGISEFRYRPLSRGDIDTLSRTVDSLWSQLDTAVANGDTALQQRLITEISDNQALINAAEGGGYFSSGGVRRYVSERPGEPGFSRLQGGAGHSVPTAERMTALIDQLPKLDHSLLLLRGSNEQIVAGVRGIAKYGGRVGEVVGDAGLSNAGAWEALIERCAALKTAADGGDVMARNLAGETDLVIREARTLFNDVLANSESIITQLRLGAELPEIGDAMRQIQRATRAHLMLQRSVDWTLNNLNIMARAIRTGTQLSEMENSDQELFCPLEENPFSENYAVSQPKLNGYNQNFEVVQPSQFKLNEEVSEDVQMPISTSFQLKESTSNSNINTQTLEQSSDLEDQNQIQLENGLTTQLKPEKEVAEPHQLQTASQANDLQNEQNNTDSSENLQLKSDPTQLKDAEEEEDEIQMKPAAADNKSRGENGASDDIIPSGVNVHKESNKAKEMGALAFAQGNDIHFAPGQYNPSTKAGQELIGHELHHVVQQKQGRVKATKEKNGMGVNDDKNLEKEADDYGVKFAQSLQNNKQAEQTSLGGGFSLNNSPLQKKENPNVNAPLQMKEAAGGAGGAGGGEGGGTSEGSGPISVDGSQAAVKDLMGSSPLPLFEKIKTSPASINSAMNSESTELKSSFPNIEQPTGIENQPIAENSTTLGPPQMGTGMDGPNGPGGHSMGMPGGPSTTGPEGPVNRGPNADLPADRATAMPPSPVPTARVAPPSSTSVSIGEESVDYSAGTRPNVDTSGEADPAQMTTQETSDTTKVQGELNTSNLEIDKDHGEDDIYPHYSELEQLTPTVEIPQGQQIVAPEMEELSERRAEVDAAFNTHAQPKLTADMAPHIEANEAEVAKMNQGSQEEWTNYETEKTAEEARVKTEQETAQTNAQTEVDTQKQNWQAENDAVKDKFVADAAAAKTEYKGKIDTEINTADSNVSATLTQAEVDAKAKADEAQRDADEKERESEEKKGGGFFGWLADKASKALDWLKDRFNEIIDALKTAVDFIIETAKKAADVIIEAARRAITSLIEAFGAILKTFVDIAFAAFPEIRDRIKNVIDTAVDTAVEVVNTLADGLKDFINALLDALGNALKFLLDAYQKFINFIIEAVRFLTVGLFKIFQFITNLVVGAWKAPPQFMGCLAEDALGGNPGEPLKDIEVPNGQEDQWARAMGLDQESGDGIADDEALTEEMKNLLTKGELSDSDVTLEPSPAVELSDELLAQLAQLQDGETQDLGGAGGDSVTTEEFQASAADAAGYDITSIDPELLEGENLPEEEVQSTEGAGPDFKGMSDETKLQYYLDQMLPETQQVAAQQPAPGNAGKEAGNTDTSDAALIAKTGRLGVGQRLGFMGRQMMVGMRVFWDTYKAWIIGGLVTALIAAGAIAFFTGGAGLALAVDIILKAMIVIFGAIAIAKATGHVWQYVKHAWAGNTDAAGKSLAMACAVLVNEFLIDKILMGMGKVFRRTMKAVKASRVGRAAARATNVVRKGTQRGTGVVKKGLSAIKNSRLVVKMKGVVGKGVNSFMDLRRRILEKFGFDRMWFEKHGAYIELWANFNPKIILVRQKTDNNTGETRFSHEMVGDGSIAGKTARARADDADGIIGGKVPGTKQQIIVSDDYVSHLDEMKHGDPAKYQELLDELHTAIKAGKSQSEIRNIVKARVRESTAKLRKGISGPQPKHFQAHHIIPRETQKQFQDFFDRIKFKMEDGATNGIMIPPKQSVLDDARSTVGNQFDNYAYHLGSHGNYTTRIENKLLQIERQLDSGRISEATALIRVQQVQQDARNAIMNGGGTAVDKLVF